MSRVYNVKKAELQKIGYSSLEEWLAADTSNVYIGRNMVAYVPGAKQSIWKNPFTVKKCGLEQSLQMYYQHVINNPDLMQRLRNGELSGKNLGCWCVDNHQVIDKDSYKTIGWKCHGQVLIFINTQL